MKINWRSFIMKIFFYVSNIVLLNLYWILFTVLGGVILGVAPATLTTSKFIYEMTGDSDYPTIKKFWIEYKENFWLANRLQAFSTIVMILSLISFRIVVVMMPGKQLFLRSFTLLIFAISYLLAIASLETTLAISEMRILDRIRLGFSLIFMYPGRHFLMILGLFGIIYLLFQKSALLILFGASLPIWLITVQYRLILERLTTKYANFKVQDDNAHENIKE